MDTVIEKKTNGKASDKDVKEIKEQGVKTSTKPRSQKVDKETTSSTKPEQKKEKVEKIEKVEEKKTEPVLSIDEKISKVENLKILVDKREKLQESRKKLNSFVIGSHQFSENIVLTDGEGNTFNTSNTEVFASVVDVIRNTLETKIKEIETQIEF